MAASKEQQLEALENELVAIKRLLVALLVKLGASSEEIGAALDIHPGSARKLFPIGKFKKVPLSE